jgi:ABC-type branched-subunit amino acid transport system substrate-binding protein
MNRRNFLRSSLLPLSGSILAGLPGIAHAQGTPLVIGQSVDLSGPTQGLGRDYFTGAKVCFDQTNASGGINGRTLRLQQLDDAGQPARTVANVAKLLNDERADVLFGFTTDACITAAIKSPAFAASDRLLFAPMTGSDLSQDSERVFYLRATYGEEIAAILSTFRGAGLKSFAIAHSGTATGLSARDAAMRLLQQRGIAAPALFQLEAAPQQLAKTAEAIIRQKPQAIAILADTIPTALLARELRLRDPGLFVCATSSVDPGVYRELIGPELAAGTVFSRVVPDPIRSTEPIAREFAKAFDRYFDETPTAANLEGYMAARALVAALKRSAPSTTSSKLLGAIRGLHSADLAGWKVDLSNGNRGVRYVDTSVVTKNGLMTG